MEVVEERVGRGGERGGEGEKGRDEECVTPIFLKRGYASGLPECSLQFVIELQTVDIPTIFFI
jgi:hypothetical protein